jgi:hypothetical protein
MNRKLALALLVVGFLAATSPVWAATGGNPTFSSLSATPGQTVQFLGTGSGGPFARSRCTVTGPDEPVSSTCSYNEKGQFSGSVVIPLTASPGTTYLLIFCALEGCTDKKRPWTAANSLLITAPPGWGQVPTGLHCQPYDEASVLLQRRGLRIQKLDVSWRIGYVLPAPGTQLSAGATVTPYPLRVPSLTTGVPYAAAAAQVRAACATPIRVGPTDGGVVVVGQTPAALTIMPNDLLVTVSVSATGASSPTTSTASSLSSSGESSSPTSSTSSSATGQVLCCVNDDHHHHHRRRAVLIGVGGSLASAFAVAGSVVFVRRRRLLHLQPVLDPAAVVVSVSEVRPSRQVTEGRRGRVAASVLAVTRRSRIEIEEQA